MARRALAGVLLCLCCGLCGQVDSLAATTPPELNQVSSIFANGRAWPVYCVDTEDELAEGLLDEWSWGFTEMALEYVVLRSDLCPAAEHPEDETLSPYTRAIGVLALIHEAYHVRAWAWRWNESRVECQAIRHFRVGVKLLGGSQDTADELYPYALMFHYLIARPGGVYYWPACRVPEWN